MLYSNKGWFGAQITCPLRISSWTYFSLRVLGWSSLGHAALMAEGKDEGEESYGDHKTPAQNGTPLLLIYHWLRRVTWSIRYQRMENYNLPPEKGHQISWTMSYVPQPSLFHTHNTPLLPQGCQSQNPIQSRHDMQSPRFLHQGQTPPLLTKRPKNEQVKCPATHISNIFSWEKGEMTLFIING